MEFCKACGSENLREIEGDLTCIDCGLVCQERMIQDTIEYVRYEDKADYQIDEDARERIKDKRLSRIQDTTYTQSEKRYSDIKSRIEELQINDGLKKCTIRIIKDTLIDNGTVRGKKLIMLIALSIYYAGMYMRSGVDIRQVCVQLGVDWKKVLGFSVEILPLWYNKKWYKKLDVFNHADKLRRIVYELCIIDTDKQQKVKAIAEKLHQRVCHLPKFTASKNHTVILTCVFIACKVAGIKITKQNFCEEVNLSLQTLNNHETTIQQVLQQLKVS